MIWIYKINSKRLPHQVVYGDWDDFFMGGRPTEWGSTEWVPALQKVRRGDTVLAYQTDRNELVGIAHVVRQKTRGRYLELVLRLLPAAGARLALQRRVAAKGVKRSLPRGAAFGDPAKNKKVERAAMRFCAEYFRDRSWKVVDVHSENKGYDLICRRWRTTRHVEVKGCSGYATQFPITRREHDLWRTSPTFVLALVTRALTRGPDVQTFSRQEFDLFRFVPLAFMACR